MPVLLWRLFVWATSNSWIKILSLLIATYTLGAILMSHFEAGNPLGVLSNYSWWFMVTVTTVGYGDMTPLTGAGRLVAVLVMLSGLISVGIMVTKVADQLFVARRKKMKGLTQLELKNHLVIFGYRSKETLALVEEIKGDKNFDLSIIICSNEVDENPLPEDAYFVKGDISSDDVLVRSCTAKASRIVIHGKDDHESITTLLAAYSVNKSAHMVVLLSNPENQVHVKRINQKAECIVSLGVLLAVQAFQDPGTSALFLDLIGNNVGTNDLRRLDLPVNGIQTHSFGKVSLALKKNLDSLLIAVAESHDPSARIHINPAVDTPVGSGMSIFYIGPKRFENLDWDKLVS